jgi:hypothetical protein
MGAPLVERKNQPNRIEPAATKRGQCDELPQTWEVGAMRIDIELVYFFACTIDFHCSSCVGEERRLY